MTNTLHVAHTFSSVSQISTGVSSKTSWERFDSSRRLFCWLTLAWFFTFSNADIRFASEGLTRLENLYGCRSFADDQVVELFSAKECATAAQGTMIKAFVARSRRSRMSPSRSSPSIRITPIFSLQTPQWHYPTTPA